MKKKNIVRLTALGFIIILIIVCIVSCCKLKRTETGDSSSSKAEVSSVQVDKAKSDKKEKKKKSVKKAKKAKESVKAGNKKGRSVKADATKKQIKKSVKSKQTDAAKSKVKVASKASKSKSKGKKESAKIDINGNNNFANLMSKHPERFEFKNNEYYMANLDAAPSCINGRIYPSLSKASKIITEFYDGQVIPVEYIYNGKWAVYKAIYPNNTYEYAFAKMYIGKGKAKRQILVPYN